jgi:serine/threonine protein kinase
VYVDFPNTRLGNYDIRSQIGVGGMGKVYLAHDTKLDRKVALKILPADVAADEGRIRRFAYLKQGNYSEAIAELQKAVELSGRERGDLSAISATPMGFLEGMSKRRPYSKSWKRSMQSMKRSAKTSPPCTRAWGIRTKPLDGSKRTFKLAVLCW